MRFKGGFVWRFDGIRLQVCYVVGLHVVVCLLHVLSSYYMLCGFYMFLCVQYMLLCVYILNTTLIYKYNLHITVENKYICITILFFQDW